MNSILSEMDKERQYKLFTHVLDANIIPSGQDLMGKVCGGQLTVSCTFYAFGRVASESEEVVGDQHNVL